MAAGKEILKRTGMVQSLSTAGNGNVSVSIVETDKNGNPSGGHIGSYNVSSKDQPKVDAYVTLTITEADSLKKED